MLKKLKHHLSVRGVKGTVNRLRLCLKENGKIYTLKRIMSPFESTPVLPDLKIINSNPDLEVKATELSIALTTLQTHLDSQKSNSAFYLKKLHTIKKNLPFNNQIYKNLHSIPVSNGIDYYDKTGLNIAIITDEFTFKCFEDTANLIYLNGHDHFNYSELMKTHKRIDCFIYITGWVGMKNNDWIGAIDSGTAKNEKIKGIIKTFRDNKVPTIFYSIEDPSDYHTYINLAKLFDVVFTTTIEKLENYKQDCRHNNCYVLEFAVNPKIHNPIGLKKAIYKDLFFAGSYMLGKFEERTNYLDKLFKVCNVNNIPYKIVDRNYLGASLWEIGGEMYRFPTECEHNILPEMEYDDLLKAHKLFDWCVNANSIVDSKTMMAMRVYEMQGMGRALISNYAPSVSNKFPNIFILNDHFSIEQLYSKLDAESLYRLQLVGVRNVFGDNTYFERLKEIIKRIDLPNEIKSKRLLVILEDNSYLNYAINQSFLGFDYEMAGSEKIDFKKYEYVTYFGSNNHYGYCYLEDMMNTFKYSNVDYVTKLCYRDNDGKWVENIELDYTKEISDKEQTIYKIKSIQFDNNSIQFKNKEYIGFASDRFNLNENISKRKIQNPELSIIVPVYNNGTFFRDRLLPSLLISRHFEKVEILLVDDGSNDNRKTQNIIKEIADRFNNVKCFFLEQPASGSASRPRNYGLSQALASSICFIDPDDCINTVNFDYIYERHVQNNNEATFSALFMMKNSWVWDTSWLFQNQTTNYVLTTNFHPRNITCSFFRKNVFIDNKLTFIENAFGEDTLLGYQLLDVVSKIEVLPYVSLIYFDDRDSSANNYISRKYFEKHIKGFNATLDYFDKTQRSAMFFEHAGFSILQTFIINEGINKQLDFEFKNLLDPLIKRILQLDINPNKRKEVLDIMNK